MKMIFDASCSRRFFLLLAAAVFPATLAAQDDKEPPVPTGFIRIANAVAPGIDNVKVEIDGKNVYPPGYKFGAVTGGIGLPPGTHNVTISREGVKQGTSKVNVEKDQTVNFRDFKFLSAD